MSGELAFSAAELAAMTTTQEAHMMDAGQVLVFAAGAANDYGVKAEGYTPGSEIACGFEFANLTREVQGETEVVQIDAHLRLAKTATITAEDRFRLTKRFGAAVSPTIDFEIVGEPRLGPSGLYIDLKKVMLP